MLRFEVVDLDLFEEALAKIDFDGCHGYY